MSQARARAGAKPHKSFKARLRQLQSFIKKNKFDPLLIKKVDWLLIGLVLAISLFGVVCIFAATGTTIVPRPSSIWRMIQQQPKYHAMLQLLWTVLGIAVMGVFMYFSYQFLSTYSNAIYWGNIILLTIVLFMRAGRGSMNGWFYIGTRTFQPSEIAKLAIVITLAKWFSERKTPVNNIRSLLQALAYVGLPLVLILLQPDFGTALVYLAIFAVMMFLSGLDWKLLAGVVILAAVIVVPLWNYLINAEEVSFRLTRILIFLDPSSDPDSARQITNAKIAIGSGGLWGKGLFANGSFAVLDYLPDDHTDFIFSIVGETFGFVGAGALILAYLIMIIRMTAMSSSAGDSFGTYLTIGIMAMMLFHIVENVCMVMGLLPVTGIPLPFVSYGGSNMLTNYAGIGIVMNVYMRRFEVRVSSSQVRPQISI